MHSITAFKTGDKKEMRSSFFGTIVASFPAVKYGTQRYRHLENDKKVAVRAHKGKFDCSTYFS